MKRTWCRSGQMPGVILYLCLCVCMMVSDCRARFRLLIRMRNWQSAAMKRCCRPPSQLGADSCETGLWHGQRNLSPYVDHCRQGHLRTSTAPLASTWVQAVGGRVYRMASVTSQFWLEHPTNAAPCTPTWVKAPVSLACRMASVTLLGSLPAFFLRGVPVVWSPALPAAQDMPAWSALPRLLGDESVPAEAMPAQQQQLRSSLEPCCRGALTRSQEHRTRAERWIGDAQPATRSQSLLGWTWHLASCQQSLHWSLPCCGHALHRFMLARPLTEACTGPVPAWREQGWLQP